MDIKRRKANAMFIEDCWVKIFAMHVLCLCPNAKAKDMFIEYVLHEHTTDVILSELEGRNVSFITEEYVIEQFPNFINYLIYSRT